MVGGAHWVAGRNSGPPAWPVDLILLLALKTVVLGEGQVIELAAILRLRILHFLRWMGRFRGLGTAFLTRLVHLIAGFCRLTGDGGGAWLSDGPLGCLPGTGKPLRRFDRVGLSPLRGGLKQLGLG